MLTTDQREYILKGRDAETNAEKKKTYDYRIRIKAREAIIDLKFLLEHLPSDQQKQIFLTDKAKELVSEIVEMNIIGTKKGGNMNANERYRCRQCGELFMESEIVTIHVSGNQDAVEILQYLCEPCLVKYEEGKKGTKTLT